jgi:hypothetical protein
VLAEEREADKDVSKPSRNEQREEIGLILNKRLCPYSSFYPKPHSLIPETSSAFNSPNQPSSFTSYPDHRIYHQLLLLSKRVKGVGKGEDIPKSNIRNGDVFLVALAVLIFLDTMSYSLNVQVLQCFFLQYLVFELRALGLLGRLS